MRACSHRPLFVQHRWCEGGRTEHFPFWETQQPSHTHTQKKKKTKENKRGTTSNSKGMSAWVPIECERDARGPGKKRKESGGGDEDDGEDDAGMSMMMMYPPSTLNDDDDEDENGGGEQNKSDDGGAARGEKMQYLVKMTVTPSHLFVYLSDGQHVWSAVQSRKDLAQVHEYFNPSVEIDQHTLLTILSTHIFGGDNASTTYKLCKGHHVANVTSSNGSARAASNSAEEDEEDEEDFGDEGDEWACRKLTLMADTFTAARVKLHWEINLERGTRADEFEHLTAPLLGALTASIQYTAALEV